MLAYQSTDRTLDVLHCRVFKWLVTIDGCVACGHDEWVALP